METSLESFPMMLMMLLLMTNQLTTIDCNAKKLCSQMDTVYAREKERNDKQDLGDTYVRSGS